MKLWPTVLLPALLAPVVVALASATSRPILLPLAATAACYPSLARCLLRGRTAAAVVTMTLWAVALSASIIAAAARDPAGASAWVPHGAAYRDEMFAFIATGQGREAEPARFLPQHAAHLVAFGLLSVISAGLLGVALGAVLIGYMSYYVGALVAAGGAPLTAWLLGWPPYAVLRVMAYVMIGVALARPLLARLAGRPLPDAPGPRFYGTAAALLLADVLLKTVLAARWAEILRPCLAHP